MKNPQDDVAGQPQTIPNTGFNLPLRAENNLNLAVYWLGYHKKKSRATDPADITLESVRSVRDICYWEMDHADPSLPSNLINV